jgi:hypothetical protein
LTRGCAASVAAALCGLACLLVPSVAGAETVGAPLGLDGNLFGGCEEVVQPPQVREIVGVPPSCTLVGNGLAGGWTSQTPRGSWVIDKARVRTGPRVGPMAFTILRSTRSQDGTPAGLICCTVSAESQVFTPAPNTINEVAVRMPAVNAVENINGESVEVVDYLAISILSLDSSLPVHTAVSGQPGASATLSYIAPAARLGQERLLDGSFEGVTTLINGDFQPAGAATTPVPGAAAVTSPFALLPGVKLVGNGTGVRLGANVPGPGILRAGPAQGGGARIAAVGRKKPEPELLGKAKRKVKKAGKAYIVVRLTKLGKRRLNRHGKLKIEVRVSFKPDGGGPAVGASRSVTFHK